MLYQVCAKHFVAGFICEDKVIKAAPIIRYMCGWNIERVQSYCRKKSWELNEVPQTQGEKMATKKAVKKPVKKVAKKVVKAEKSQKAAVQPSFMIQIPPITLVATEVDGVMMLIPTFERKTKNALLKATRAIKSNQGGMDTLNLDTEEALKSTHKPGKKGGFGKKAKDEDEEEDAEEEAEEEEEEEGEEEEEDEEDDEG